MYFLKVGTGLISQMQTGDVKSTLPSRAGSLPYFFKSAGLPEASSCQGNAAVKGHGEAAIFEPAWLRIVLNGRKHLRRSSASLGNLFFHHLEDFSVFGGTRRSAFNCYSGNCLSQYKPKCKNQVILMFCLIGSSQSHRH